MQSNDIGGVWKGSYFLSNIVAFIKQNKNSISGHVEVQHPFSKIDTYHFSGTVTGNKVQGAHYRGSNFKGVLVDQDRMIGVITTYKGNMLHITINRISK